MLSLKFVQVAALALAAVGFGLAPAADAYAGSCSSNRPSHDRWHSSNYDRPSHDRWHKPSSHTRHYSHRDTSHRSYGYDSRTRVSYRNDNVRFSVSLGSGSSHSHHRSTYHNSYPSRTVVYTSSRSNGYWTRVYRPPVYETRYRPCGTPYRVCVRAGYYERVWVSTGSYCR